MNKVKYYPCVLYANNIHTLRTDGRYHNLSSSLKDVCYATYKRALQDVNKQRTGVGLKENSYNGLVLSSEDFKYLDENIFNNDDIYFDADKNKCVYEYIKNKFVL